MLFLYFKTLKFLKLEEKLEKYLPKNDREGLLPLIYKVSLQTYNKIILF